jgi:lipopolysaccharide transport protein LptA
MDSFSAKIIVLSAVLLMHSPGAAADEADAQAVVDAESTTIDRSTNTASFTGLRIRQGDVSIEAAAATVRGFDSERRQWSLEGKVRIQIGSARITAEQGAFEFVANRLTSGELSGDPAVFEDIMPQGDGPVRGTARRIYYDNAEGIVRMEDGASFTVGANQVKGCDLIYDLKQERVTSGSSDCGEPFTITIVPSEKESTENEPARSP